MKLAFNSFLIVSVALVLSCTKHDVKHPKQPDDVSAASDKVEEQEGLTIVLEETPSAAPTIQRTAIATTTPLDDKRTAELLRSAKGDLKTDKTTFKAHKEPLPRPKTDQRVNLDVSPAKPAPRPDAATSKELSVQSFQPEGKVPIAGRVSVTFSHPMVAISSQEKAAGHIPIKITPEPQGRWRWLGTKTIVFEAESRFPMATEYLIETRRGIKDVSGRPLNKPFKARFQTPPTSVVRHETSGKIQGDNVEDILPTMYLIFDQNIDHSALLRFVTLGSKSAKIPVRRATTEEIAEDFAGKLPDYLEHGSRWIAVKPKRELQRNTDYALVVKSGAPSQEGSLTSVKDQTFEFSTRGPLKLVGHRCRRDGPCRPNADLLLDFNNPLDPATIDVAGVTITPAITDAKMYANYRSVVIAGRKSANTTYHITFPASTKDKWGETLGTKQSISVKIGPAEKWFRCQQGHHFISQPHGAQEVSFTGQGYRAFKARIFAVQPKDFERWKKWLGEKYWPAKTPQILPPFGELLDERIVQMGENPDAPSTSSIDLATWAQKGARHFAVIAHPVDASDNELHKHSTATWVQLTKIGLFGYMDGEEIIVWASSLKTGEPLVGASVQVNGVGKTYTTDSVGITRIPIKRRKDHTQFQIIAHHNDDTGFIPSLSIPNAPKDRLMFYTFSDRGVYKPGDTVYVKGWSRNVNQRENGDLELPDRPTNKIKWTLGWRDKHNVSGKFTLSPNGGFSLEVKIPKDISLGKVPIVFSRLADTRSSRIHHHELSVQEFRTPEFEVSVDVPPGPYVLGDTAVAETTAKYYSGGALNDAQVTLSVRSWSTRYTPPNRDDYQFGPWQPWWRFYHHNQEVRQASLKGRTDSNGKHTAAIHFQKQTQIRPMHVEIKSAATDVNRQTWNGTDKILLHPSRYYCGLRTQNAFSKKGATIPVETIAVDIDGQLLAGVPVHVALERIDHKQVDGQWEELYTKVDECQVPSSKTTATCSLVPPTGGTYKISAIVKDPEGRPNLSEIRTWVQGDDARTSPNMADGWNVELVPERKAYRPGETARVLIKAPFVPAEGIATVIRSGIIHHERFTMNEAMHVLEFPVEEKHIPQISFHVELVAAGMCEDPREGAPLCGQHTAEASLDIEVSTLSRTLSVTATPSTKQTTPGAQVEITFEVRDAQNQPVPKAEVAAIVTNEAVLALTAYELLDPVSSFYSYRPPNVMSAKNHHLVAPLWQADSGQIFDYARGAEVRKAHLGGVAMATVGHSADPPEAISTRKDFRSTALFAPSIKTDKNGRASVKMKLPDSLTRYRIMAVAVSGATRFGKGEGMVTASLPLMVRPSPPRFLNFGDQVQLPIVLQNNTDQPLSVETALQSTGVELSHGGVATTIPANDRVEVRFEAKASSAGTGRFKAVVKAEQFADANLFELPVYTPATTETFATYGEIAGRYGILNLEQQFEQPTDVWPQLGGLEIQTSSTQLQELTDAFVYLTNYPFECTEQVASRLLSILALEDTLRSFGAAGLPSREQLEQQITKDIQTLVSRQQYHGDFGIWGRSNRSWPYLSVHATHALARAVEEEHQVPKSALNNALKYVSQLMQQDLPDHSPDGWATLQAYAQHTLYRAGHPDLKSAHRIFAKVPLEKAPLETLGWLLPVFDSTGDKETTTKIVRHLMNRLTETPSKAHFVTSYEDSDQLVLHSSRRTDAVILDGLIEADPYNEKIVNIARGLLAHRVKGRWGSTQENVFALLALDRYFDTYEERPPYFHARAWIDDTYLGSHYYAKRTTRQMYHQVPMEKLLSSKKESQSLLLQRDGEGTLYYRIGFKYAPKNFEMPAVDYGFAVTREYEAVDDPKDVTRDDNGVWRIKAGARVRVNLSMATPMKRHHVALVDPLPAGFEALNPALATTEDIPSTDTKNTHGYWWWRWYEHDNLRDDRVEAFASQLPGGAHTYSYVARATTTGRFIAPPTKAEEMYSPETFGRCKTEWVEIYD